MRGLLVVECTTLENCFKNVLFCTLLLFLDKPLAIRLIQWLKSACQDWVRNQGCVRPSTGIFATQLWHRPRVGSLSLKATKFLLTQLTHSRLDMYTKRWCWAQGTRPVEGCEEVPFKALMISPDPPFYLRSLGYSILDVILWFFPHKWIFLPYTCISKQGKEDILF